MECLLVTLAAVLGLLAFRASHLTRWGAVTAGLTVLMGWGWSAQTAARRTADVSRAAHLPLPVREGFSSSDACRSCHPSEYASWHATYHRTMTQPAEPAAVQAPFDGRIVDADGHAYRLEQRGDRFIVDVDGTPRPVAMVTGSHHQQRFWLEGAAARSLDLLPIAFLIADRRWVPGEAAFVMPPGVIETDTAGAWNHNCVGCHSVAGAPRLDGAPGPDTRVAELGIACEACHGPGAAHVAAYRDPVRRYVTHVSGHDPDAIVNPARLPSRAASAVCGQCHAVFVFRHPHQWRGSGADYRAGGVLDDDRYLIHAATGAAPEQPSLTPDYFAQRFWRDGEVRVSGREYSGLAASACFQRGELSCLHCHSMHTSAPDDQLRSDRDGDRACLPCHAGEAQAGLAHTHHAPDSSGSRCANCHMPYTTFGLLKAIRTHRIASPSVAATLATGRPDACTLCHLDRTLAWSAEHLSAWYGVPPVELTETQRTVAASLIWLLQGDAGQRALAASSFGWGPAQAVSGNAWMAPFLAVLLDDPYSAVRYTAARSLRTLPGYADFEYDFVGSRRDRRGAQESVMARWRGASASARPELLISAGGKVERSAADQLRHHRDDRPVALSE